MKCDDRVADAVEHLVGSVVGGIWPTPSSLSEKRSCLRLRVVGLIRRLTQRWLLVGEHVNRAREDAGKDIRGGHNCRTQRWERTGAQHTGGEQPIAA
jgi:hypothetical protein